MWSSPAWILENPSVGERSPYDTYTLHGCGNETSIDCCRWCVAAIQDIERVSCPCISNTLRSGGGGQRDRPPGRNEDFSLSYPQSRGGTSLLWFAWRRSFILLRLMMVIRHLNRTRAGIYNIVNHQTSDNFFGDYTARVLMDGQLS